ncbi:MAG: transglutaminase family protein [Planctomycetota bacterium]
MLYQVTHETVYDYGDPVPECFNIVRLNPRPVFDQVCLDHQLEITPKPEDLVLREDYFGNRIEQFSIHVPHRSLTVNVINRIDVTKRRYPSFSETPAWEKIATMDDAKNLVAAQFSRSSPRIAWSQPIAEYARTSFAAGRPIAEAALDLNKRIFEDFEFDPNATTVSTPVRTVFQKRAGVCQDFAHFQIACFRSLGLPARYVSGYLRTIPPPGQERLIGADASHAWTSLYCGEDGWFDFDPTNNLVPETDHITIAWGRDYSDVCPIQGVFTGGGNTVMKVAVDVAPIDEGDE